MILSLLGLIPGFLGALQTWLKSRSDAELAKIGADKDVAVSQLGAIVEANNARGHIIALPGVRWLMMAMYAPCIAHLAGIVLGRMMLIKHDMLPLDSIEQTILLSLVIYVPASKWVSR
jgi:hypothetical protein